MTKSHILKKASKEWKKEKQQTSRILGKLFLLDTWPHWIDAVVHSPSPPRLVCIRMPFSRLGPTLIYTPNRIPKRWIKSHYIFIPLHLQMLPSWDGFSKLLLLICRLHRGIVSPLWLLKSPHTTFFYKEAHRLSTVWPNPFTPTLTRICM